MARSSLIVMVLMSMLAIPATGEELSDEDQVRAAILDYVEGIYLVQPERIERSVSPELTKVGYSYRDGNYREIPMSYERLVNLAKNYNADGEIDPETAPKEVVVFEAMDKTASGKLVAQWGIDLFHLVKEDGRWKILHVLWQSPPSRVTGGAD